MPARPGRAAAAAAAAALALLLAAALAPAAAADDAPYELVERPQLGADEEASTPQGHIILLDDAPPLVSAPPSVKAAFKAAFPQGPRADAAGADAAAAAAAVDAYAARLKRKHAEVLAAVASVGAAAAGASRPPPPRVTHHYTVAVNGFAAAGLTDGQVDALRARPDVLSVSRDARAYPMTFSTPTYLGLKGPGGLWEREFGTPQRAAADVLVGIIDTGIDSSVDSFAGSANTSDAAARLWPTVGLGTGACGRGDDNCTPGKLLACRYFEAGADFERQGSDAFTRAKDDISTCFGANDHGTHVASTAAGNDEALKGGNGMHDQAHGMSGMAPGAALAAYKIIWGYVYPDGVRRDWARESDTIAAVDQAIRDGVEVINYSVGGPAPDYSFTRPMFESFKAAAAAGIFIAASAGNSGPGPGSMGSNGMPWVATVAAGTHARKLYSEVTITSAAANTTAVFKAVPARDLVALGARPLYFAGSEDRNASQCRPGSLDAAAAKGKVVVCVRSDEVSWYARVDEVKAAGGVGMILVNDPEGKNDTARVGGMTVPTVHANAGIGRQIVALYEADPSGTTASLSTQKVHPTETLEAPTVAAFSSRGPVRTDGAGMLKPDILAPGADIFAASSRGRVANFKSGTSMSSPHIAGIAALIKGVHPSWSPAAIKSAIMSTAGQTTNRGNPIPGTPFDFGAGHVDPSAALDPGLVYNASKIDYDRYSCAMVDPKAYNKTELLDQGEAAPAVPSYCAPACAGGACAYPQAVRDLNVPSFAFANLRPGEAARARRVATFVGPHEANATRKAATRRGSGGAGAAGADDEGAEFSYELILPPGFTGKVLVDSKAARKAQRSRDSLQFSRPGEARAFTLYVSAAKAAAPGWAFGSLTWRDAGGRWSARSPIALEVA